MTIEFPFYAVATGREDHSLRVFATIDTDDGTPLEITTVYLEWDGRERDITKLVVGNTPLEHELLNQVPAAYLEAEADLRAAARGEI